jgi:iron(III) transport system ATP-binding protein
MHNHADKVSLDDRVRVGLDADHDLAWFPQDEQSIPGDAL